MFARFCSVTAETMESFNGNFSAPWLHQANHEGNGDNDNLPPLSSEVENGIQHVPTSNGPIRKRQWRTVLKDSSDISAAEAGTSQVRKADSALVATSSKKRERFPVQPKANVQAKSRGRKRAYGSLGNPIFAVQCDTCLKWRIVPTEGFYEEIRSQFSTRPFVCKMTAAWGHMATCNDVDDITVEESQKMWAVDRPDIPKTPAGWKRLVIPRSATCTRIGDVYYISPTREKFRSRVEIQRYLDQSPYYKDQPINIKQFDFAPPVERVYDSSKFSKRNVHC